MKRVMDNTFDFGRTDLALSPASGFDLGQTVEDNYIWMPDSAI